jgi:hypothetical protein
MTATAQRVDIELKATEYGAWIIDIFGSIDKAAQCLIADCLATTKGGFPERAAELGVKGLDQHHSRKLYRIIDNLCGEWITRSEFAKMSTADKALHINRITKALYSL